MEALKVLILGVSQYNFKDNNGKDVKGTTVHYIHNSVSESDKRGYTPAKATLPYEAFGGFSSQEFPCVADAYFTFDLSNKRNPIKITSFKTGKVVPVS